MVKQKYRSKKCFHIIMCLCLCCPWHSNFDLCKLKLTLALDDTLTASEHRIKLYINNMWYKELSHNVCLIIRLFYETIHKCDTSKNYDYKCSIRSFIWWLATADDHGKTCHIYLLLRSTSQKQRKWTIYYITCPMVVLLTRNEPPKSQ